MFYQLGRFYASLSSFISSFSVVCVLWGDGIQFCYFVVPSLILANYIDSEPRVSFWLSPFAPSPAQPSSSLILASFAYSILSISDLISTHDLLRVYCAVTGITFPLYPENLRP